MFSRLFPPVVILRESRISSGPIFGGQANLVNKDYDIRYVLAILNSKLIDHYYHLISLELGRTMAQLDIETIEQLPIKEASKQEQRELAVLVDKMLNLNKQLNDPAFAGQQEVIQKEIEATDIQIDEKVFDLYGLTEEEKKIVRGASPPLPASAISRGVIRRYLSS